MNNTKSSLLTRNTIGEISASDQNKSPDYLEVVKAFARLTYESVYVIDYEKMSFEYVSDNPLFLCGYTAAEVQEMGYDFYFRHVPENDLEMLGIINEVGFDFYERLPIEEKKNYSITYDFHLINKDNKKVLINHKLTPLLLTAEGKLWKSLCAVSISNHKTTGNIEIYKQGSDEMWTLNIQSKVWQKSSKASLTKKEIQVLQLHAQGLTINEIAEKLHVAPDTIKYYRRKIFERLNVSNILEALSYAVNRKII
ncbi:MAG: helix-turn-helix transcriptional regulator [Flavobacterium psychrophilum]|nr:MAG: helix-turn-helix transcriptional regulator [Flavobacterium psychrophilum]